MTGLLLLIIALIGVTVLEILADALNLISARSGLPAEFSSQWSAADYDRATAYRQDKTRLRLLVDSVNLLGLVLVLVGGLFGFLDRHLAALCAHPIGQGLLFMSACAMVASVLDLPFSLYQTFVIERRHGFNRITPRTFILDLVKGWVLTAVLGLPLIAGVFWFFLAFPHSAWLWAWGFTSLIQLFILYLAPVVIAPWFNRFTPLPEGDLRDRIAAYAARENFRIRGVYTMDGSQRSTKANAYFCGFGRFRRIVLFDTLIQKFTPDEILTVVAHEMGHFKLRHIPIVIAQALGVNAITFLILAGCIGSAPIAHTLGFDHPSLHAGLMATLIFLIPVTLPLKLLNNLLSRRHEYQADAYAAQTTGQPEILGQALIKLTRDHLADLTPHPLKVLLDYSHPPILARLKALAHRTQPPAYPSSRSP
jgi:STE24 endopeptidase